MKTLYESILGNTTDRVKKTVDTIKKSMFFGGLYEPDEISLGMKSNDGIGALKLSRLKELNNGKEMMNWVKMDDAKDERMYELIKYIENVNLADLGFPNFDCTDGLIYYDFVEALESKMKLDGIFNRINGVRVSTYKGWKDVDRFWISIRRSSKCSGICVIFKKKS